MWRCHELIPTHLRFKKKTAYAVLCCKPYQYCILCCCQFLTTILFFAMQLYFLAHCKPRSSFAKSQPNTQSNAKKRQSFQPPPPFLYSSTKIGRSYLNIMLNYRFASIAKTHANASIQRIGYPIISHYVKYPTQVF